MRRAKEVGRSLWGRQCWLGAGVLLIALGTVALGASRKNKVLGTVSHDYAEARTLFEKIWEPGRTTPGGDGLGPVFNESSCVGCHHLGGTGGGGGNERNVRILTAFVGPPRAENEGARFKGELEEFHPGFKNR